jgi:hypothetical protein
MGKRETNAAIRSQRRDIPRNLEPRTPIAEGMFIPNLSGIKAHPEAVASFGYLDSDNTWTATNTYNSTAVIEFSGNQINLNSTSLFNVLDNNTFRFLSADNFWLTINRPVGNINDDRHLDFPAIQDSDTFAVLGLAQTFTSTKTFDTSAGTNPAVTINWNDSGGTADRGLSIKQEGTEKMWFGEIANLYTGMVAPVGSTIFFGITNDAASDIDGYLICQATNLSMGAPTDIYFQIGFGVTEATLAANLLTFNNGATDTYIGWATSGQLDLGVTSTNVVEITASKCLIKQTAEIDGALDHDGTTVGFYGVTPTTRPTAYTQTYATATRTHSNPTATTVTDTNGVAGFLAAADRTAMVDAVNALIVDVANVKQVVNQILDDLQLNGLLQ